MLNFEVFLTSCSWIPQTSLISFQRTVFLFELVQVAFCSKHPNVPLSTGIGQTQALFLHPIVNLSPNVHLLNALGPNPTLKP